MIANIEATIPPLQERVNIRRYLYERQVGSQLTYLSKFQDLVGQQHDLLVQQSRRREADAAIKTLIETRSRAEAEYRRTLLDAENKVDPFNFTRYGLLHGRVTSVSRDAIARNREEQPSLGCDDRGAQSATSEPNGQELVYTARAVLDRTHMDIEGAPVQLLPGMAVTVEIRTGSRRIISYLLSPLIRYRQESPAREVEPFARNMAKRATPRRVIARAPIYGVEPAACVTDCKRTRPFCYPLPLRRKRKALDTANGLPL
jgi:hypothetical protein